MTKLRFLSWLFALAVGFGLGLTYSWIIAPVKYVEAQPKILREDFKDYFRSAIAAAYASNADLERARARLDLLGDPDPSQALAAQAQRMLAEGESAETVQQVAMLSSALQGQVPVNPPATSPPTATPPNASETSNEPAETSIIPVDTVGALVPTLELEPTGTPIPQLTATARQPQTATPTLGAPYQLVGQDTVCDSELAEGLLQVVVTDARRQQIPGAEIIVTWNNGEEHFFTGMKPELGYGYADFLMTPDITYSVRMADGGTPASELSTPDCTDTSGNHYPGGLKLTFQQP